MAFRKLSCSFCRRSDKQVAKLVAGARGYICDVCAAEAHRIMSTSGPVQPTPPPAPARLVRARVSRWIKRVLSHSRTFDPVMAG
jgi:ATP-dependent protease Clp ATPase subunit